MKIRRRCGPALPGQRPDGDGDYRSGPDGAPAYPADGNFGRHADGQQRHVSAAGDILIGTSQSALTISAPQTVALLSNTSITVNGGTTATTGDIIAAAPGGVTITAVPPVGMMLLAQTAGRDIFDATTTGTLTVTGDVKASRNIFAETVSGAMTFAGNATAVGDLTLISTAGPSISSFRARRVTTSSSPARAR